MMRFFFLPFFPLTTEFKADGIIAIKKKVTRYFKYEEVDEKKKWQTIEENVEKYVAD